MRRELRAWIKSRLNVLGFDGEPILWWNTDTGAIALLVLELLLLLHLNELFMCREGKGSKHCIVFVVVKELELIRKYIVKQQIL